jgi:hypothetical protein
MAIIWGSNKDLQDASKESFEDKIMLLLKKLGSIHLNDLLSMIKHDNILLIDYQRILLGLENLVEEGKIFIDEKNNIHPIIMTVFEESGELKEKSVWDIDKREKDIEEKKEIIRRYSEINFLQ